MAKKGNGDRRRKPVPETKVVHDVAPSAPRNSMRSTFTVARAQRQLAADLPSLIYSKERPQRPRRDYAALEAAPDRRPAAVKPARTPAERDSRRSALLLDDKRKCRQENRPDPSKRTRGSGAAPRPFVPWCSKH